MKLKGKDLAYWIADKIPAYGDYAKEAADILRDQANKIEQLEQELAEAKKDQARYQWLHAWLENSLQAPKAFFRGQTKEEYDQAIDEAIAAIKESK